MRRIFVTCAAIAAATAARAELVWDRTTIERTLAPASEIVEFAFSCTNRGAKPVRILHAQPSCGCTTATLPTDQVSPGGRAQITLYFDPKGLSGSQEKIVRVFTDEQPDPFILQIRAIIPARVTFPARLLLWTLGEECKEKEILITVTAGTILKIPDDTSDAAIIHTSLTALDDGNRYRLTIAPRTTKTTLHCFLRLEACLAGAPTENHSIFVAVY